MASATRLYTYCMHHLVEATSVADFGDYNQFESQDFLREYVLFPVKWTQDEDVLEDLTQKVAREHKSHCGMPPAEAELLYIKEVEQLEGFGQESFSAKVNTKLFLQDNLANDIDLSVSFMGVSVKHRNGRSTSTYRWNDLGNITHNKSAISIELTNKEETTPFHTVSVVTTEAEKARFQTFQGQGMQRVKKEDDMEMAKYISRLFTARHKFYKQNKICTE
ncbi:UNVERIFIED_CONTAM: hypothetical protein FKN15_015492 [Acipenser sinensis]